MPESDPIETGDIVTLTVPETAVGLTHADCDGRFTVEGTEVRDNGRRLYVTPTQSQAPRYVLNAEHVTQANDSDKLDPNTDE